MPYMRGGSGTESPCLCETWGSNPGVVGLVVRRRPWTTTEVGHFHLFYCFIIGALLRRLCTFHSARLRPSWGLPRSLPSPQRSWLSAALRRRAVTPCPRPCRPTPPFQDS